jgi:hypothetical protein
MDFEDEAYQTGIQIGENTIPNPILRNMKLDVRVSRDIIEHQITSHIHIFLIRTQLSKVDETIKRKYYTDSFLKGFWVGYSKVYKQFNQYQQCAQEVLVEWGKRKGPLYLSYYFEGRYPSHCNLIDLNLITMIRNFTQ